MRSQRIPRLLSCTAGVLLASATASGQLAGDYTVDPAGAGPRNFPSLDKAIAALEGKGVAGPVALALAPGTHRGSFELPPVDGTSEDRRIVLRKAGEARVVLESAGGAAIAFANGAAHYVLDGLTFGKTDDAEYAIRSGPGTSDIEVVRCHFNPESAAGTGAIHVEGDSGNTRAWHIHANHFRFVSARNGLHLSQIAAFDIHDNVFVLRDVQHCLYLINFNDAKNHIHHNVFTGAVRTAVGIAASNLANHVTDNLFAITTDNHAIETFGMPNCFNHVYRNTFALAGKGGAIQLSHPTMLALRSDQNLFASASGLIGTIHGEKPVRHQGLAAWQKATADLPLGTSDQRSAVVPATTLARHAAILELLRTGELPAERAAAAAALAQIGQLLASPEPAELRLGICAAGRAQAAARPAIPKLAGLCSHEDPAIRGAAAEALGKIRQTAEIAVPDICRLLAEDDAGVLLNAVRALAAFGPFARPALPRLKELAKAPAEDRAALRRAAEDTIKAIVGDPPVKRAE